MTDTAATEKAAYEAVPAASSTVRDLVTHDERCCMTGAQPEWGPHQSCPGRPLSLRAISIRQPWVWAILHAGKDVENRGRRDPWIGAVGERIYLHAAKTIEPYDYGEVRRISGQTPGEPMPVGALVGVAVIAGVHHAEQCRRFWNDVERGRLCSPWAQPDSWHLQLRDVLPLQQPIPWRGALGLFTLTTDAAGV